MDTIMQQIEHMVAELQDLRIEAEGYLAEAHPGCLGNCPIEALVEDTNQQILAYCSFLSLMRQVAGKA